jgi:predicted ATP-dependent protease
MDPSARARLLDLSTRLAEDRQKLSLALQPIEETAFLASDAARRDDRALLSAADIDEAWNDRRQRRAGAAIQALRQVTEGLVLIETEGRRSGVVNGLAVFSSADLSFGQPMRISAVVSPGTEGVVDVERESHLGGDIHTKGVAILRGLLSLLFGQDRPLSLRAQITFEQSYGEIDGDSASSAEFFAILSALADVPFDQGLAVTGAISQLGEVQAIGGVCEKIEGFYDLCAARGLSGHQGVLIPASNLRHLVLRDDIAQTIDEGKFHIHPIRDVRQGIALLAGIPAGERDASGKFPAASVFGRVERRLIELAERLRSTDHLHGHDHGSEGDGSPDEASLRSRG